MSRRIPEGGGGVHTVSAVPAQVESGARPGGASVHRSKVATKAQAAAYLSRSASPCTRDARRVPDKLNPRGRLPVLGPGDQGSGPVAAVGGPESGLTSAEEEFLDMLVDLAVVRRDD